MTAPTKPNAPTAPTERTGPRVVHRGSRAHTLLIVLGALVAAGVILWGAGFERFSQEQLTRVMIYAVAIAGLNIVTGYTGMVSIGHSAFFGLGAYTTGIMVVKYDVAPLYTIPAAIVVCFAAGWVVGIPALRIKGLYLAMATLAVGVAFPELIAKFEGLTGGSAGLQIRRRMLAPPDWSGFTLSEKGQWLYWLAFATLLLTMLVVHNLVRSRIGLALIATRDNEVAAAASGVNIAVVKTTAFGVSAAITGAAGSLFAMYIGNLFAEGSFTLLQAIELITGLLIGGAATRIGPIIGGFAVVFIPYWTSDIGQGQLSAVLFGVTLIAIVFVVPEGIAGGIARLVRRVFVVVPPIPAPFAGRTPPADARPNDDDSTGPPTDAVDHPSTVDPPAPSPTDQSLTSRTTT